MIVYSRTKEDFSNDILTNDIDRIISQHLHEKAGLRVAQAELNAFKHSLGYMERVMSDRDIPDDCGISIEYHIPQTSKRIDFIISGTDGAQENVIIVELKGWKSASLTQKDGLVITQYQKGLAETSHPAYQAWSYAALLQAFNATVHEENIQLHPCAYLHNYEPDDVIANPFYDYYLKKAPIFLKPDALQLRAFIKQFIKQGDKANILYRIDHGKIRPTKTLADSLKSMIQGNKEFLMIDDQKVVYENAKNLALHSHEQNKNVLIVEGGPGTGKSVIAVNLLINLIRSGKMAQYVTKTSAPRDVYFDKLSGERKKVELRSLFVGSGSYIHALPNSIATLIVDEAHRLTKQTGPYRNGEDQIKEILRTACCSIFFIDENQRVHIDDYGDIARIEQFAGEMGIKVHKLQLESQFRCNGSDGYLAWVDHVLQIRDTANPVFSAADFEFDFRVMDNPKALQELIYEKNKEANKARLVAGYCWDWDSKNNKSAYDIEFPEYDFRMRWNLKDYGGRFIIDPGSVTEVGCIHTAQGLEVDYIGVIVGDDLIVRNGEVLVDPKQRSTMDKSIHGWKKMMKEQPEHAKSLLRAIIKNTYRTLLTRGMKGCYVYFTDEETAAYFRARME